MNKKVIIIGVLIVLLILAGCKKSVTDEAYSQADQGQIAQEEVSTTQDEVTGETEAQDATQTDDSSDQNATSATEVDADISTVYPFEFVDKFGKSIIVEKEPMAIVSFSPELTETLFAIDKGDQVIGRSSYCDFPAEVMDKKDMGSLFDFNLETVLDVKPDLVLLSSMVSEDVYNSLVDNGIQVAVFDYDQTLEGTMTMIRTVGEIVNRNVQAQAINETIQAAIDDIGTRAKSREPKSVYYAVSVGDYTSAATGDTFIGDIITTIGATNAAQDGTYWTYTVEQLVEKDPDYVICSKLWDTKATIESLDGYKDLTAVKEGRLIEVDENIFSRQGPRVVDALYTLEKIVYGE